MDVGESERVIAINQFNRLTWRIGDENREGEN